MFVQDHGVGGKRLYANDLDVGHRRTIVKVETANLFSEWMAEQVVNLDTIVSAGEKLWHDARPCVSRLHEQNGGSVSKTFGPTGLHQIGWHVGCTKLPSRECRVLWEEQRF